MGTQLPSAPQAVCLCMSCSHAPMTPPPKKHNFPTGLRVRVQLPSVAFPIYSQITITITQGDEASISKTQHTAISQASWSILLVCIPKTSGCLALLPGPHGLRPVYLWLDTIVRRLSQLGEKAPIPRATFLGEASQ